MASTDRSPSRRAAGWPALGFVLGALLGVFVGWSLASDRAGVNASTDGTSQLAGDRETASHGPVASGGDDAGVPEGELRLDDPGRQGREATEGAGSEVGGLRSEFDRSTAVEIARALGELSERIDQLEAAVNQRLLPAKAPSLEMIQSAPREQNWAELDAIAALAKEGEQRVIEAATLWLSQQEVLQRYGLPTVMNSEGLWDYRDPERKVTVRFQFLEDYVVGATVYLP